MAAEIREQPAALRRTLDALLPLEPAVAELAARTRQVLFIARGSSDAAALYGRYLCEVGAGREGGGETAVGVCADQRLVGEADAHGADLCSRIEVAERRAQAARDALLPFGILDQLDTPSGV